jgi:hypothetical protein
MCGHDWCSVRISKEIVEFASGKAEGFEREKVTKTPALTPEQRRVLEQRGNLPPAEIHKLATKTKRRIAHRSGSTASATIDSVRLWCAVTWRSRAPWAWGSSRTAVTPMISKHGARPARPRSSQKVE